MSADRARPAARRSRRPPGPASASTVSVEKSGWLKSGHVQREAERRQPLAQVRRLARLRATMRSRAGRRRALQPRPAARPAPALDALLAVGLVVVGQLVARARWSSPRESRSRRRRSARSSSGVHEWLMNRASLPPTPPSITHRLFRWKHQMRPCARYTRLAPRALAVRDLLARVVDNALVLGDALRGEHAPPVQFRTTSLNHHRASLVDVAAALHSRAAASMHCT